MKTPASRSGEPHRFMPAIRRVAAEIQAQFRPQRIVLFGSHAYGRPSKDSDVDLLIVMAHKGSNLRASVAISKAVSHPFAMDLIVVKPSEVRRRLQGGDLVLKEMLEKGRTLREARG